MTTPKYFSIFLLVLKISTYVVDSAQVPVHCSPAEFTCSDGMCIPREWMCDGTVDCPDALDEIVNCSRCPRHEFECENKLCVPRTWLCDGDNDCHDGSDEKNCESRRMRTVKCGIEEFDCGNSTCIPLTVLCDGLYDCADRSDESKKCEECAERNGGCSDTCRNTPRGAVCECPIGLTLGGGGHACVDIDECAEGKDDCSQTCANTHGEYECACVDGYKQTAAGHGCQAKDMSGFALMFSAKSRLYITRSLKGVVVPAVIQYLHGEDGGLDYDYTNETVYWADNSRHVIYASQLHRAWHDVTVLVQNTGRVDGIAVDWVGRNLYWTDDGRDTIEVASLRGRHRRTLFRTSLDRPRDIVLDSLSGIMYWTDWGSAPKIEKSHMDGKGREIMVFDNITWPNGLSLDLPSNRLYWTDGKHGTIESVTLDGKHRRSLFFGKHSHPFSLAVFGDHVYWTDWLMGLQMADKRTGDQRRVLVGKDGHMRNLHVIHALVRPQGAPDPCGNVTCVGLTLLAPTSCRCACADDVINSTCKETSINRTGAERKSGSSRKVNLTTASPANLNAVSTPTNSTNVNMNPTTQMTPSHMITSELVSASTTGSDRATASASDEYTSPSSYSARVTRPTSGATHYPTDANVNRSSSEPVTIKPNRKGWTRKMTRNHTYKKHRVNNGKADVKITDDGSAKGNATTQGCQGEACTESCADPGLRISLNCTCEDIRQGQCEEIVVVRGKRELAVKDIPWPGWIPGLILTISILILLLLYVTYKKLRNHRRGPNYNHAVFHKNSSLVNISYTSDIPEEDEFQDQSISGCSNPLFSASTSSHVNPLFYAKSPSLDSLGADVSGGDQGDFKLFTMSCQGDGVSTPCEQGFVNLVYENFHKA